MKNLFLLFIMMLMPIMSFSQNISTQIVVDSIPVSTNDIKYTNFLFVEHESLMLENKLLNHQLNHYEELTSDLDNIITLQKEEINNYQLINDSYIKEIGSLNKKIKSKNKSILGWSIGGVTVSVGLLLLLLLK